MFTDPERAAVALAREHDALAAMQGAESQRVDLLVQDVGEIKGNVKTLQGDVSRVNTGVDRLMDSMTVLNRHAVQMETHASTLSNIAADQKDLESRTSVIEKGVPNWERTSKLVDRGMLAVITAVGMALLGLVLIK